MSLAGIALLVFAFLLRWGRHPWSREWVHDDEGNISRKMMLLPGCGAGLAAFGVLAWPGQSAVGALVFLVMMPACVVLGLWGGLQLRVPLWFLPGWSRDSIGRRRAATRR